MDSQRFNLLISTKLHIMIVIYISIQCNQFLQLLITIVSFCCENSKEANKRNWKLIFSFIIPDGIFSIYKQVQTLA